MCTYTASGTLLNCNTAVPAGTVTSSGSPVLGNISKFTTATNIAPAAASDIVGLFSGTCTGSNYLGADGACHAAGSGGLSGMTATQIPIAATATTVTSSAPVGTGVLTGLSNAVNTTGGVPTVQNCQSITASAGAATVNWASGSCAVVTASGANVTVTLSNPVSGFTGGYTLGICNDGIARTWTLPGTVKQAGVPILASACAYKTYAYDGANYQGPGDSSTPTVIYGTERSAPVASGSGLFICWWDSTNHNMTCNDNASGTNANMVTPLTSSTQYVQYIDAAGTQHLGTPSGGSSNACATVGNAADSTDIIGNQSLTTQQFLNTGCAITGGATAGTIDGTHKGIIVRYTFDVSADNSPTWSTTFGVCPTANFSAHACSSGYLPLYTFTTSATASTVQRAGGIEFHVTATGTQGKFATFALRNVGNAFGQPPTLTAVQDVSAAVNGGSYTFVLGVTWSATSSNTCNGVGTNGGNCLSTLGGEWLWKN